MKNNVIFSEMMILRHTVFLFPVLIVFLAGCEPAKVPVEKEVRSAFSSSALPKQKKVAVVPVINIHIRLSDIPGPCGHPLGYTSWKISCGEKPDGLALVKDDLLLAAGETDSEGWICLTKKQNEGISRELIRGRRPVWLLYPGQAQQLVGVKIQKKWSREERLFYGLFSAGFLSSGDIYRKGFSSTDEGKEILRYARESYGVKTDAQLYARIKPPSEGWIIYLQ